MPGNSQHDYRSAELDSDLLSTPYKVQTNWHVITGGSSAGKTTLIDLLAGKGFRTVPELARLYFEQELAKGRAMEEIRQDPAALTRHLYDLMLKRENELPDSEVVFLDRAIPDSLTYFRVAGMDPNEILLDCFHHRYAFVIIPDRLPYRKDGIRVSDDKTAAYYESSMLRDYTALGYNVIRVPVLPPEERLTFILDKLSHLHRWREI